MSKKKVRGKKSQRKGSQTSYTPYTGVEVRTTNIRLSFTYQGKRCRESLYIEPSGDNILEAVALRRRILRELRQGCFDGSRYFPKSKKFTTSTALSPNTPLDRLAEEFLAIRQAEVTGRTLENYRLTLNRSLSLLGADTPVGNLWPVDIQKARSRLIRGGYTTSTVNQTLSKLSALLRFARDNGATDRALAEAAGPVRETREHPADPFSRKEFRQLLSCCTTEQDRNILTLMVLTGLRPGELCALALEDIDWLEKRLHVRRSVTTKKEYKLPKTNHTRTVSLCPEAIACLLAQKALTGHLSPSTLTTDLGRHRTERQTLHLLFSPRLHRQRNPNLAGYLPDSLASRWRELLKRVTRQYPAFRYRPLYQLRHTFASWQLSANAPLIKVRDQLGHTSLTQLESTYARWIAPEPDAVSVAEPDGLVLLSPLPEANTDEPDAWLTPWAGAQAEGSNRQPQESSPCQ
ncbi:site-specific integrase [Kistimonas scapharcae]|uniref:Site-specific integrase n=1 Tax=Kistimonas scapharcae TaxID=1036133 RepID=A0ABP8UYI1_9GAMM